MLIGILRASVLFIVAGFAEIGGGDTKSIDWTHQIEILQV